MLEAGIGPLLFILNLKPHLRLGSLMVARLTVSTSQKPNAIAGSSSRQPPFKTAFSTIYSAQVV